MMANEFLSAIDTRPLLCDGAMGTMIYAKGIPFERCFDELNLSQPDIISAIHKAYVQAGADVIQTNTFGANRYRLAEHGHGDKVADINRAGIGLARQVVAASARNVFVAGTIGSLGVRLAPLGSLNVQDAQAAFTEQIGALVEAGADLLIFDTFSDLKELEIAIKAARQIAPDIALVAQMTFTEDMRTPLGYTPKNVAERLGKLPVDIIGINCSQGPSGVLRALQNLGEFLPGNIRLSAQPNAGWPEHRGGRIMYPAPPEYFGDYALAFVEAGARLIGGCCGTTPEHITHMRVALDDPGRKAPILSLLPGDDAGAVGPAATIEPTRLAQRLDSGGFIVTVELHPPKGISAERILAGASTLMAAGANAVNVADSPRARMRMSPWAICHLIQSKLGLETVLHFPTRGRNILRVQGDLLAAHALNVRNVFAVMGDPTSIGEYPDAINECDVVPTGLIKLLKREFNQGMDHSGALLAQPTNFSVGCALNLTPGNPEHELKLLRKKMESGADFALTQPVYNVEEARAFVKLYEAEYGPWSLPIVAGVLPLYNGRHADFLHHEVPGINIPDELRDRMHRAGDKGTQVGVAIASEIIAQMRDIIRGIYIIPAFDRYDLAAEVIKAALAEKALPLR